MEPSPERPETLFKFEAFNSQSLLNLKSQVIYFGPPANFNDAYDCRAPLKTIPVQTSDIETYLTEDNIPSDEAEAYRQLSCEKIETLLSDAVRKVMLDRLTGKGVSCFSALNDDLLMWAHYGGKYSGFCLEFRTSFEPFTKIHRVIYSDEIPEIDFRLIVEKRNDEIFERFFCTKSTSWAYEKEWRAFHNKAGTAFHYDREALKAVYFGPEMSKPAMEIICLILRGQNPNVEFWRGTKSETHFKVEFEKVDYASHLEAQQMGKPRQ